jgi:hypothetical protein
MPQFAVLLFEGSTEMPQEVLEAHMKVGDRIEESGGHLVTGYAVLPPDTARSIRGDDVTPGAFIASDQPLAGFFIIEANDIDHAVELGKFVPIIDGGVEVRPLR